jgi:anti-anti-sigma factor
VAGNPIHLPDQLNLTITRLSDSSGDYVQIVGEVDVADRPTLGLAARQLIEADARVVYVDLGDVTFMGSTLVEFLVHVGNANGDVRRSLVLCRPTPMARKVIHITGLDQLASVRPDLPPPCLDIAPS